MIAKERIFKVLVERIPESAFDEKPRVHRGSNLITPTLDMIEAVIRAHLIDEKPLGQIKKEVKSSAGLSLSARQIKQIISEADAYKANKQKVKGPKA